MNNDDKYQKLMRIYELQAELYHELALYRLCYNEDPRILRGLKVTFETEDLPEPVIEERTPQAEEVTIHSVLEYISSIDDQSYKVKELLEDGYGVKSLRKLTQQQLNEFYIKLRKIYG